MNRVRVEDLLEAQRLRPKSYSIEAQAEKSAYMDVIDGKRQLYVPSFNVYSMILQSSGRRRIGRASAKGVLAGLMKVEPEKIPLGTDKYEIDVRAVVVQRSRIPRARAMIRDWKMDFSILYDAETILNPYIFKEILDEAGYRMGLLDYRPQHMGPFGTFVVEKFEVEA
jgi:hypothetical protein